MLNLPVYLYTPAIRVFLDLENSTRQGVDDMYHGYATIAKGLKNTIRFRFLNGDQRPIDIENKQFVFKMFDPATNNQVLETDLTVLDDGDTFDLKGQAQLVISGVLTEDLNAGDYTYSILLKDGANRIPTYIDGASKMSGNIQLTDGVVPKFVNSDEISQFNKEVGYYGATDKWVAGPIASNRDGKGSNVLHTAQLFFTDFTGNFKVMATQDNSPTSNAWVEVASTNYTNQTQTVSFNLTSVENFNYFKFEYYPVSGSIDKVLYRS
jgi:hypothetical protein